MAASHATVPIKALIVICGIVATPVASLAQGPGSPSSTGSTGGSAGLSGGVSNSPAPPPGTNSLGTAQSSGPNAARATTTDGGAGASADATVSEENRLLDKKMKSICRGC
ncbi:MULTISPECIES: hypothetical protein [unclassified Bradyrhizobium]|uniref:hypothetical protein n=1 Tax=unclassified Bradyrhizobium TaxID=2631580 RepID=UPI001FF856AD|nr:MULTISPECIES: hypothetical protein [unclassified Bradyrhizobium]MCK1715633.1 hypothetical protein [Bradyrhizobium sp. 143]MCK1726027.1 hypothetical protein [Bradyrhizobium sp. 142]